jgi:hypothetical protein
MFAAAVAGAPITNFLSFAGAIHWTPGIAEFDHWETGQARMGVPFWEDMEAYIRNSPAAKVHELRTPMLMEFGDADGTVDWHQGIEFYNFARRAGRDDFVMLVYPGEDHGLRKKENQIDYHRRINQWFGPLAQGRAGTEVDDRRDDVGGTEIRARRREVIRVPLPTTFTAGAALMVLSVGHYWWRRGTRARDRRPVAVTASVSGAIAARVVLGHASAIPPDAVSQQRLGHRFPRRGG